MSWLGEAEYIVVANINPEHRTIKIEHRIQMKRVQIKEYLTPYNTQHLMQYHSQQIRRKTPFLRNKTQKGNRNKSAGKGFYSMCVKIQRNHHPHGKSSNPPPPPVFLTSTAFPTNRP